MRLPDPSQSAKLHTTGQWLIARGIDIGNLLVTTIVAHDLNERAASVGLGHDDMAREALERLLGDATRGEISAARADRLLGFAVGSLAERRLISTDAEIAGYAPLMDDISEFMATNPNIAVADATSIDDRVMNEVAPSQLAQQRVDALTPNNVDAFFG
jgi:hypothetical protein